MSFLSFRPFILAVCLSALAACSHGAKTKEKTATSTPKRPRVVLISIDGLRPEFYLSRRFHTPTLKKLVHSAAYAERAIPVFPTLTYPNHVTMVTGVAPAQHGIYANTVFSQKDGLTPLWHWEERYVKVPTLWMAAKKNDLSVAIMRWPSSVGAEVDWILPEIFAAAGESKSDWQKIFESSNKNFLKEIMNAARLKPIASIEEVDAFNVAASVYVLGKYHPDLTLIHLIDVDYVQHMTGRDSVDTRKSVSKVDKLIAAILAAVDLKTTRVIVTGDHGFLNYHYVLNLNSYFVQKNWIELSGSAVKSWKAMIHSDGGQAAVYCKDKSIEPEVYKALNEFSKGRYRVYKQSEGDGFNSYPEASFILLAKDDYIFGSAFNRRIEEKFSKTRGHHGHLQSDARIHTGFLAVGEGIKPQKLKSINIIDIAPTIASWLDLSLPDANGKIIPLLGNH